MEVATYFLENAAVLKKLTLSLTNYPRYVSDEEIFEEVNRVAKRSPTCQILPDWDLCEWGSSIIAGACSYLAKFAVSFFFVRHFFSTGWIPYDQYHFLVLVDTS